MIVQEPPIHPTKVCHWKKVGQVHDFPVNAGAAVLVDNRAIAVCNLDGQWYAIDNECPHRRQKALAHGLLGCLKGEPKIACPFHKKTFSLKSGACLKGDEPALQTWPVIIVDQTVYLDMENTATKPMP